MSELIGRSLPPSLHDLLARRMTTVIVATLDEEGHPHTAPYNQVIAVDAGHLRLAVNRQDATFRHLRDYGLTMIAVLEEGDIAAGIKGRARILRQQMQANCNLALIEVEIDEVKKDNSPQYLVVQGIRTRLREEPFLLSQKQILAELRD